MILTSSKEERDLVQSYGNGANSPPKKPVDFDQFLDTIKQAGFYWFLINQAPLAAQSENSEESGKAGKRRNFPM